MARDDSRLLARPAAGDEQVAERLAPARQRADLLALVGGLDHAERPDGLFAVVAGILGAAPNAVAFLDGTARAPRFIERFHHEGIGGER
jgi:hypothetical protein